MKFAFLIFTVLLLSFAAFGQTDRDQGIALYYSNDFDGAVSALQTAVKTDPNDRDAWFYLGMSLARVKNTKEAVKALRKGDKISAPTSPLYDKEVEITQKPRPSYTDEARMNMTQGKVKLAVEFGADKKIKAIVPVEPLPNGLTQNAVKAAKDIKFEPALKNGVPVSSIKIVEYSFKIYST